MQHDVITLTAKTQLTDLAAVSLTAIGQRVKTCARVLAGEGAHLLGKFFVDWRDGPRCRLRKLMNILVYNYHILAK